MSATQSIGGLADLTHTSADFVWNQAKGLELVKTQEKGLADSFLDCSTRGCTERQRLLYLCQQCGHVVEPHAS